MPFAALPFPTADIYAYDWGSAWAGEREKKRADELRAS